MVSRLKRWGVCGILLGFLAGAPAVAQEEHGEAEHEEHHHPNEVALFLGGTHEAEGGEDFFTIGGEYSRVLTPRIAVSAVFEHISEIDAWVVVFPVGFTIYEGWYVNIGPGFEGSSRRAHLVEELEHEIEQGHHVSEEEVQAVESVTGRDRAFLLRFGTGYKWELGSRYAIIGGFDFDLVFEEGETAKALVFGAKFAVGF